MRLIYLKVLVTLGAIAPVMAVAQSASSPTPTENITAFQPADTAAKSTMFKIGTGLTRGFSWGMLGLSVPVVLGIEHHVSPAISVYGNLSTGLRLRGPRSYVYSATVLSDPNSDAGVRYYYNQAKRKLKNRATGHFVGNYLAVHSNSSFFAYKRQNSYGDNFHIAYEFSSLNIIWGMQRRVGDHGLFDAFIGAGIANRYNNRYFSDHRYGSNFEGGLKLSLVR